MTKCLVDVSTACVVALVYLLLWTLVSGPSYVVGYLFACLIVWSRCRCMGAAAVCCFIGLAANLVFRCVLLPVWLAFSAVVRASVELAA